MRRIIGVGSPFGADQLGWRAIDLLQMLALSDCELIKLDRPGADLIRYLEGRDEVVIIDAVQAGESPGRLLRLEQDDLAAVACQTSSHGFGVAETLAMAAKLGALPARLTLLGIETGPDLSVLPEFSNTELLNLI